MGDNRLGRNIQHLRKIHGETLEALGEQLGFVRSTMSGYEQGDRTPTPDTIQRIAEHYDMTVDDLLNQDLTGIEPMVSEDFKYEDALRCCWELLPLFRNEQLMEEEVFKKAFEEAGRFREEIIWGRVVSLTVPQNILKSFAKAAEATAAPEARADVIGMAFTMWFTIGKKENADVIRKKMCGPKADIIKTYLQYKEKPEESAAKRKHFLAGYDEQIGRQIRLLAEQPEWSELAYYYIAMRYLCGMVDRDDSLEVLRKIGVEMMLSLAELENPYADRFFEKIMKL